jgi:hypothetical protein
MIGALQATAQAINPNWSVTHFVWALEPCPVDMAPSSYGEAVASVEPLAALSIDPRATVEVADYLASVGLVASETNRRAAAAHRTSAAGSLSQPKQMLLRLVYSSPRRAAAFKRVYARLR